ncbi:MAG: hypothetical protein E1N59_2947 [Puniceicoccaceae bacterium 5H]|nr:MAG: hypothetical protein E1N59_2947 [Puniceicoccaceae bacterium 5H]
MKIRALCLSLLALIWATLGLSAETLTNDKIVSLSEAGLSDDTIVLAIQRSDADFDLETDALIALRDQGVSAAVIDAMVQKQTVSSEENPAEAYPDQQADDADAGAVAESNPAAAQADLDQLGPPKITPEKGQRYYTRFGFKYEGDDWPATNYWRGAFVPINTEVELVACDDESMSLLIVDTGVMLEIDNIEKYTHRSMLEYASLMLAAEPTNLSRFSEEMQDAIKAGRPHIGMTKEQVIYTRGYPPFHRTPSLKSPEWIYWHSRFNKRAFRFDGDGILVSIRN